MKLSKISAAVATIAVASFAQAEIIPAATPVLGGLGTNEGDGLGGSADGVSAVAVIASCETISALMTMQGLTGSFSVANAPNISSAELRAMLTGAVASTTAISGDAGTLSTVIGAQGDTCPSNDLGANAAIQFRHATGTNDAVDQFLGAGVAINGFIVGAGSTKTTSARTDDADCIGNMASGRVRFCTVHATSLGSPNIGFVKLDGSAPTLANLMSSNYNMVSNLHGTVPSTTVVAYGGGTFGAYVSPDGDMNGDGVAYHNAGGSSFAAAPLANRGSNPEQD